ncbi:MAG: 2-phospho-L-lactate transferase [Promethearchaeota archaeon]
MTDKFYLLLAGGVGAAKFIEGLASIVDQNLLKIIVNTGDDIELFGLKICPDLDIITYTLAGLIDKEKGWGFKDETFNCLSVLKKYYNTEWFNAGDKDLATHIYRTNLFNQGYKKDEITNIITEKLGVKAQIIPMCNEPFETYIKTREKIMHFEEYYIKEHCEPDVLDVDFKGVENAKATKDILTYIKNAERIVICPSNPIVSIGTILQVQGIKDALVKVKNKVIGISPIIQGATVKGPADKLMKCFNLDVSCVGVSHYFKDILGHFIIDERDTSLKSEVEKIGIHTYCFDTLMINQKKKEDLAQFVIELQL